MEFDARDNSVLLFSGGIDSYVAWHYLGKPQTVYFDLQGRYSEREKKVIKDLIPSTIIDNSLCLGDSETGENAYIPFRNMLLAARAVKYSDNVFIAGLVDDMVSDKNNVIFRQWSNMFSQMEGRVILIDSPFWFKSKADVVKWYLYYKAHGGQGACLKETISCYREDDSLGNYCGKCNACFRKWVALGVNGVMLPFYSQEIIESYYKKAKNFEYYPQRNENIIKMIDQEFK